ncbi:hypothetical protein NQZ79_g1322 [Umbelopsis isabellina]|nr:hypothetical protein NQZ79_g1322 [Umbelopsis isabellina]
MSRKSEIWKSSASHNGNTGDNLMANKQQMDHAILGLIGLLDQPVPGSVSSIVQADHDGNAEASTLASNAGNKPLTVANTIKSAHQGVDHSPHSRQAVLQHPQKPMQATTDEDYYERFAHSLQLPRGQYSPLDRAAMIQGGGKECESMVHLTPATGYFSEADIVSFHSLPNFQAKATAVVADEASHSEQYVESSFDFGRHMLATDDDETHSEENTVYTSSLKNDKPKDLGKSCDCEKGIIVIEASSRKSRLQFSRSSIVMICFATLVSLSVILAFIWPRLPLFQVTGASLWYSPQVSRYPTITKYAAGWNLEVSVDNRNNYLPTAIVDMDIFVRHSASGTIFGHGRQQHLTVNAYTKYNMSLALNIDYDGKPDDPIMHDLFVACGPGPRTNETHVLQVHFGVKISIWGLSYFGYNPTVILTPPSGGFGRDDECAGSEAICLNSVCSSKTASLNSICSTEVLSDGYSAVGVVRDNCTSETFCSALNGIGVCQEALFGGATCLQNRQCMSQQCNNGICEAPASSADSLPAWKWAIIGVIIALCLISIAFVTYTVLRKKRLHGLGILRYDDPSHKPRHSRWPPRWASRWALGRRRNTTADYNLDEPEKPVVQDWNHGNITETCDTVAITPTPSVFPIPPRRSPAPWKQNRRFASKAVDHVHIRLSGTFTPTFGNGHHKPNPPAVDTITSPANAYSVMSEEDEMRMWQAIRGDTPPWPVQGKGWKFARGTRSP